MGCENSKYVGRDVMLEYAIGCGDKLPEPQDWKQVGAMRAKNFGLTWDSTDVTADDSVGALRENLATFQSLEISGDGIAKKRGAENFVALTKHIAKPTATNGQPVVWMRMTFPDLTFIAFMMVSDISRAAPYDDAVTYSLSATATASDFGLIIEDTPGIPTGIIIDPNSGIIDVDDATLQLSATLTPPNSLGDILWSVSDEDYATVDEHGLVTPRWDGSIIVTAQSSLDPDVKATQQVLISNQSAKDPLSLVITPDGGKITTQGGTLQLSVAAVPQFADDTVTWSSLNPSVATVDPSTGEVTAITDGTASIRATSDADSNVYAEVVVEVEGQ